MEKKSLYALLVAIDKYPPGVRALNGCVNDMHAFRDYLARQCDKQEFEFKPRELPDEEAGYQAVIDAFEHFKDAKAGDVCVLYYSGHGSRIPTNDFWEAFDGKNESIVCWDSRKDGASNDLVDKELSCLIHKATTGKEGVHFLAVMDCCHSGTNTRGEDDAVDPIEKNAGVREAIAAKKGRPISQYYGFKENMYLPNNSGQFSAPKGRHMQFGACRNFQTAKEIWVGEDIRGAFTLALIEALDTAQSRISYADLERRVGQKIENRVGNQRPQIDPVGVSANETFLGGAVVPKNRFFVSWNESKTSWELNAGEYQGIALGAFPAKVQIKNTSEALAIGRIYPDRCQVIWPAGATPDKKVQYEALVSAGGAPERMVALLNGDAAGRTALLEALPKTQTSYIHLIEDPQKAAFRVHAQNDSFWLTQVGADQPLFLPVKKGYGRQSATEFWKKADNVLQWFHLKTLENPASSISPEDFTIELFRGEKREEWWTAEPSEMERIPDWSQPTIFRYQADISGKIVPSSMAVNIKNNGKRTLFVSALVMSGRFGISNEYLTIRKLEQDEDVWLTSDNAKSIGLGIDEDHYLAGLTEQIDFVKIIIATEDFETTGFNQDSLIILEAPSVKRDGLIRPAAVQKPDWTTRLIPLHIIRPQTGVTLVAGQQANLEDKLRITAPAGFSAKASLVSVNEPARDTAGDAPPAIDIPGLEPLELTKGFHRSVGLSGLRLANLEGIEQISPQNPLKIEVSDPSLLAPDEVVMPFMFDPETQAWYPAGLPGNGENPMEITSLPADALASRDDDESPDTRGLGKSLKMFFYKITVGKPVIGFVAKWMGKMELYQLAAVEVPDVEEDVVPVTTPADIQAKFKAAKSILLFVHGIVGATDNHIKFVRRLSRDQGGNPEFLQQCYDLVLTFDYDSLGTSIKEIAGMLKQRLAEAGIKPETMEDKILHVVAHSMGGLVVRWWIEEEDGKKMVNHFIEVGTPNDGSKMTRTYDWTMAALTHAINFVPIPGYVKSVVGWAARYTGLDKFDDNINSLKPGSDFLTDLSKLPDPSIPYTIVCGDTALMDKQVQAKQEKVFKRLFKNLRYNLADLMLNEPNDMVVPVSSVKKLPDGRRVRFTEPVGCDHFSFFREPAGLKGVGDAIWALNPPKPLENISPVA